MKREKFILTYTQSDIEDVYGFVSNDRDSIMIAAMCLKNDGWKVEVSQWTDKQRKQKSSDGSYRWCAGYVEIPIE